MFHCDSLRLCFFSLTDFWGFCDCTYRVLLQEVSDNLNRLKELGKSLFLITHDPELIYKCCTYLLFIQGSKVLWHRPMDGEAVSLLRAFFSHAQEAGAVNAPW